jgi:GDP-L-fucose synthase
MELKDQKITVTGGAGFLGSWVVKKLEQAGAKKENIFIPRSRLWDLREKHDCRKATIKRNLVIHLAGQVGGIGFNRQKPAELFYNNLIMGVELLHAAYLEGVEKLVVTGTVCAYPKLTPVPFREESLWNGYPEETNAPYGLAKKMLLVQAQAYRQQYGFNAVFLLPVNLYGPGDHFEPEKSHVIPALIKKIADAKRSGRDFIEVWGTGSASREFLYVEDAAEAVVLASQRYDKPEPINIGSGVEITIDELTKKLCRLMDFNGEVRRKTSEPDGQPRRCLDVSKAEKEFGFKAHTTFDDGLRKTIDWYFLKNRKRA